MKCDFRRLETARITQYTGSSSNEVASKGEVGRECNIQLMEGRAIQIVSKTSEGKLRLDENALAQILLHPDVAGKPISIICVAGKLRIGKSFLLNILLRYLLNNGHENNEWLGNRKSVMNDGFAWHRGGDDRSTRGIHMWSQPLLARGGGKEIAVFLLDTQGNHNSSGKEEFTKLLAISLLFSSSMVFNVCSLIQANDLEYLQFCAEYTSNAAVNMERNMSLYQKLIFLVRDWCNPKDYEYGAEGGQLYLDDHVLKNDERNKLTLRSFDQVECYLMPNPGEKVEVARENSGFQGCLEDIDNEFVSHLSQLAFHLLHPDKLIVKKSFSGRGLLNLIARIFTAMQTNVNCNLPCTATLMESAADVCLVDTLIQIVSQYSDDVEKIVLSEFTPWESFKLLEQEAADNALSTLTDKTTFGGRHKIKDSQEKLRGMLESFRKRAETRNTLLEKMGLENLEELMAGCIDDFEKEMQKVVDSTEPELLEGVLVREYRKFVHASKISFKRDAKAIFHRDVDGTKLENNLNDAFCLLEMQRYCYMENMEFQLLKRVCRSLNAKQIRLHTEQTLRSAIVSALTDITKDETFRKFEYATIKTRTMLENLLQKGCETQMREIMIEQGTVLLHDFKKDCENEVLDQIRDFQDYCLSEDAINEHLEKKKQEILEKFAEERSRCFGESKEKRENLEKSLNRFIDKGFRHIRRRNKRYLESLEIKLQIDSLQAEIEYFKKFKEEMKKVYLPSPSLDGIHSKVIRVILPRKIPDISSSVLEQHNEELRNWMKAAFANIEQWKKENEDFFSLVFRLVSGGQVNPEKCIPSGTFAVPVVVLAGVVLATGSVISHRKKQKEMKIYFKQETELLQNRIDNLNFEQKN